MVTRVWMSWSSGKDSAHALEVLRAEPGVEVTGLLVSLAEDSDTVTMHGTPRDLVSEQADRLGLPVHPVHLPWPCPNEVYEARMGAALAAARTAGVEEVAFGDLFLEDVRRYREERMAGSGLRPRFPLWGRPTGALARDMLASGLRAVVTCVDLAQAPAALAGRQWDTTLLDELPEGVDPCGERGELHTFVWDAPGFSSPVPVEVGPVTERDGFATCAIGPAG